MPALLKDLEFKIRADNDTDRAFRAMERNIRGSDQAMRRYESQVNTTFGRINRHVSTADRRFKAFAGAVGLAGLGLSRLPGIVREVVAEASQIGKAADKIGLSVENLQELRFAGELAGVGISQTDMAMQRFSRRLAEAATGSGDLYKIIKANGLALRDQNGRMRSTMAILRDYADLIKNAGSEQDRLLLAFKAFDSEGAAFVNALNKGSDGLDKLIGKTHEAGGVLSDDLVRSAEHLDDQFQILWRNFELYAKRHILQAAGYLQAFEKSTGLASSYARNMMPSSFQGVLGAVVPTHGTSRILKDVHDQLRGRSGGSGGPIDATPSLPAPFGTLPPYYPGRGAFKPTFLPGTGKGGGSAAGALKRQAEQSLELEKRLSNVTDEYKALHKAAFDFGDTALDTFQNVIDGTASVEDALKSMTRQISRAVLEASLLGQGPLAGVFGTKSSGGLLGAALPGFATGGSFTVGGSGGTDSQLVAFRASPDETVHVIPPGRGGGGRPVVINKTEIINQVSGAEVREERGIGADGEEIQRILIEPAVNNALSRGPAARTLRDQYGAQKILNRRG